MKHRQKREICRENSFPLLLGLLCFAAGLFLLAEAFLVETLPYEKLTKATVVVKKAEFRYGRYSYFIIEDSKGNEYNIDGDYDWGLEDRVQPGKTIAIRYQPAYYRLRNGIQELCVDGDVLVTYRNNNTVNRIGFLIIGGLMVLFAGGVCAMFVFDLRQEKCRRNRRNIRLHRKYGDNAKLR